MRPNIWIRQIIWATNYGIWLGKKRKQKEIIELLHERFDWLLKQNSLEKTGEAEIWLRAIKLIEREQK